MSGPPPINYATHPRRTQHNVDAQSTPAAPDVHSGLTLSPAAAPSCRLQTQQDGSDRLADFQQDGMGDHSASAESGSLYSFLLNGLAGLAISPGRSSTTTTPASSPTWPRRMRTKYYSVTVGRRCGVFAGWTYVHSLVNSFPGSTFSGFKTYEEAFEDYYDMKAKGHVYLSGREPGDEQVFGPLADAIM